MGRLWLPLPVEVAAFEPRSGADAGRFPVTETVLEALQPKEWVISCHASS